MLIESEDIKEWLKPILKANIIHFSTGDYITSQGEPYYKMYKFIQECEQKTINTKEHNL